MRRVRFVRGARVRRVLQEGAAPLAERLRVHNRMRIGPVGLRRDLLRVEPGALVLVGVLPTFSGVVPRVAPESRASSATLRPASLMKVIMRKRTRSCAMPYRIYGAISVTIIS